MMSHTKQIFGTVKMCDDIPIATRVGKGGIYHGKNQVVITREKLGKKFWWEKPKKPTKFN